MLDDLYGKPCVMTDLFPDGGFDIVFEFVGRFNEDAMVEDWIATACRKYGITRDRIDIDSVRALVRTWNGSPHA